MHIRDHDYLYPSSNKKRGEKRKLDDSNTIKIYKETLQNLQTIDNSIKSLKETIGDKLDAIRETIATGFETINQTLKHTQENMFQ